MKNLLIVTIAILSTGMSLAQVSLELGQNNANPTISDNGIFFQKPTGSAGYEIPKGDGNHTSYSMSFWMGGLDEGNQLHVCAQTFEGSQDMFAGPIADDYNSIFYTTTYDSAVWKVSKTQINYHTANYTATGYVPDPAIANWPGNGNTAEGIAAQLAPYIDVNNDLIYNPLDGDYPYIQGDEAVYVIMNDAADVHQASGGDALGVEIHVMFYQINSTDDVNNTTFMNVKLFNRSNHNYHDFYFGIYNDYDLGQAGNDWIGCDTTKNLGYVYNGDNFDAGGGSQPGYGTNPPAFGTVFLSEPMETFLYFNSGGGVNGDPVVAINYYRYLQAIWKNGAHVLYGGDGFSSGTTTTPTNFMFSGSPYLNTGWTEISEGNPSGDRRAVMATGGIDFAASDTKCIDVAFIYNRDGANNIENAHELLSTADFIKDYYDNNIQPCSQIFLAEDLKHEIDFSIFPNPSAGNFYIELNENAILTIYDLNGQIVASEYCVSGKNNVNLNLISGFYVVQIKTNQAVFYKKIEVIK